MSDECCFINANIVLEDKVVSGHLLARDGKIAEIGGNGAGLRNGGRGRCRSFRSCRIEDLEGDYLLPGLVELHTDNLEKHLEPRSGVLWPSGRSAFVAHDAQVAAAGITTVFDSISVGQHHDESNRQTMLGLTKGAMEESRKTGRLRAEHRLHLRCELSDPHLLPLFASMADEPELSLVSLMDHTPGQRQFINEKAYRAYYRKHDWSNAEFVRHLERMNLQREEYSQRHAEEIRIFCRERRLPMASHDDVTVEHVNEAVRAGMSISEFPTTLEAARHASRSGLVTLMGTPNVLRGGSHSGNVSALEVAKRRSLGALSSDYVPASLLPGAYILYRKAGYSLPEAVALVSKKPAAAVGLFDRGSIAAGKKADLLRVSMPEKYEERETEAGISMPLPEVRTVWRDGVRVL
ncbi:MAG: alpha-D-ribose 1-methylphosphonate 5-triphosphate diphosphatase [Deltaproteobacteria bacterium]|jgi:alpha-D-ribose 1-methylphosphonate 5-triphosphate diphosphatase|nr:alpha-D-ribose 1-methylphosphonate 5-triphosphate diphosphatase [Deltaproteobacteria bacterium]